VVAGGVFFAVVMLFFSGTTQVANEALQYQLQVIGRSIYEYHAKTGQWPDKVDDLDATSIGIGLRYWKPIIQNGSIVIVWHDKLHPDPKDNAGVILAYHNEGLLAWMGRKWVCWGDLRTEYLSSRQVRDVLKSEH
jgi:hypothetical protein